MEVGVMVCQGLAPVLKVSWRSLWVPASKINGYTMRRWVGHFLWRLFWRKTSCRCSVLLLGFSGKLTSFFFFFTFMGLSLSSVFPAGCFSPHLADISVYMILKSAQICILCEMCAELLICCCVVFTEMICVSFCGSVWTRALLRFLLAGVTTVQVHATEDLGCIIRENSLKRRNSLYPAEVSEGQYLFKSVKWCWPWTCFLLYHYKLLSWCCCCVCVYVLATYERARRLASEWMISQQGSFLSQMFGLKILNLTSGTYRIWLCFDGCFFFLSSKEKIYTTHPLVSSHSPTPEWCPVLKCSKSLFEQH